MNNPRVSIILAAYHSDSVIGACLAALDRQTFTDFEVVIVSSSPEERTRAAVGTSRARVCFEQSASRLLPHAARNRGVALARGDILVFSDPDCRARPDWLSALVGAVDAGHSVVGGAIASRAPDLLGRGIHLSKFSLQLEGAKPAPSDLLPTANVAYTRAAWEQIGPFEGDLFCGDSFMSRRADSAGLVPFFEPRAVVEHEGEVGLRGFLKQRAQRGREFAASRANKEAWSTLRAARFAALTPIRVPHLVALVGGRALRGGAGGTFASTLPVQLAIQSAWAWGEMRAALDRVAVDVRTRSRRPDPRRSSG